jgi:hypothetical protein
LIGTDWSISVANSGEQVFTGVDDQILFVISDERVFAGVDDQIPSGYSGEQALAGGDNPAAGTPQKIAAVRHFLPHCCYFCVLCNFRLRQQANQLALRWTNLPRCWR